MGEGGQPAWGALQPGGFRGDVCSWRAGGGCRSGGTGACLSVLCLRPLFVCEWVWTPGSRGETREQEDRGGGCLWVALSEGARETGEEGGREEGRKGGTLDWLAEVARVRATPWADTLYCVCVGLRCDEWSRVRWTGT